MDYKAIIFRMVITFCQAALAELAVNQQPSSKTAIAGAIGAGISAVVNLYLQKKK